MNSSLIADRVAEWICAPGIMSDPTPRYREVKCPDFEQFRRMISPYVRRQRLAIELQRLRDDAGLTHAELAKRIDESRMKITRLENGRVIRDGQAVVMKVIDALGVTGERWTALMDMARDATQRGWWASYGTTMGIRQSLYADLEAGAAGIREFQPFIPGLLQTPEFAFARQLAEAEIGPVSYQSERAVEARQSRQRMLRRSDGPSYEVILDEVAMRRLAAPPTVFAAQVEHLIGLAAEPRVEVRVLPVGARIEGYVVPRSPFSIYDYPDTQDPRIVAVDTVTTDVVLNSMIETDQVVRYANLYDRLRRAALTLEDSTAFLRVIATELTHTIDESGAE
jgi:transcriptional regulator with XRE-family HTH domain